jgi:putative transposase
MKKGNVYRIYPTEEQKIMLEKHFGACRFIYNRFLHIRQTMYDKFKISITRTCLDEQLPIYKETYPWLKEVNSQSLQQANKNLDTAYKNFFEGRADYPTKKTKRFNNSFQVTQRYKINLTTSQIYLPNIGWIKVKIHRELLSSEFIEKDFIKTIVNEGVVLEHDQNSNFLRTVTVSRTPTRKYHISILTEDNIECPEPQQYTQATTIGVDVGIKTYASLSNGEKIDNPKFLKSSLQRLKCLQRRVSRKHKGSKNRRKAVQKLAKCHEKVSNQRHDFQHKISNKLISENQAVAVETLNIKGMVKNHKLAQVISDSAWYSFVSKLEYKAKWFGKTVLKIRMFEPSSKNCHVCGYHNAELTLKDREWQCPECSTLHDRDTNAAINIKKFAISAYQITAGTAGRACGVAGAGQGTETGSFTALA